jgi:hypothetical protein
MWDLRLLEFASYREKKVPELGTFHDIQRLERGNISVVSANKEIKAYLVIRDDKFCNGLEECLLVKVTRLSL